MEQESFKDLKIKSFKEAAAEELKYMQMRKEGKITSLKTRWNKFNQVSMNGLEWGSITTIAGISGSGKTAILNEMETSLFELNPDDDFAVLSFNFEMVARRLVGRKISAKLNKTMKQLYSADMVDIHSNITNEEYIEAQKYVESMQDISVNYVDMPGTTQAIEDTIYKFNQMPENKYKGILVTLDHSILVKKMGQMNQQETLYDLMFRFNRVKKRIKASFVVVSQLNRTIETVDRIQNTDMHYPMKTDIFGADALYQYSDVVLVSHRPEMLGIREYGPDKLPTKDLIYWHYLKVRDGEPIIAQMLNNLKHNQVLEVAPKKKQQWNDF
tara:strand:+ start:322 stop:1302 length:981 start_codon:yes stop_codon:yes gene_type:complete